MSDWTIISLLFVAGFLILTIEIFVPSHGILSVVGVGFLVTAIVQTFRVGGQQAGAIAVLGSLVTLPTFVVFALKIWPRTLIGRRIAPPNPTVEPGEGTIPIQELNALIGREGMALTPLRPVGTCTFGDRRITCMAQVGMINQGTRVVAVGISLGNLAVVELKA